MRVLIRSTVAIALSAAPAAFAAQPPAASPEPAALPANAVKLWALTPEQAADPVIAAAKDAMEKSLAKTVAPQNPPRYLFVPVTPCTIFDTRYATNPDAAGFIGDGVTKRFNASHGASPGWDYTAQGGSDCSGFAGWLSGKVPEAVLMTAYVSDMTANGWVTFYSASDPDPSQGTISVYYAPGPTRTQTVVTRLAQIYYTTPYEIAVTARYGGANVSASVAGFFIRQAARNLSCVAGTPATQHIATPGTFSVSSGTCASGIMTSISCKSNGDSGHTSLSDVDVLTGQCAGMYTGTSSVDVTATPFCCRVPDDVYPY